MSTGLQDPSPARELPPPPDLVLRNRRGRRAPLIAGGIVVVVAVAAFLILSGGSAKNTVAGSHFGSNLKVAYEADSGSERAFLTYLNSTVAPKYGVHIVPVGIGDGNQLDQATADGHYAANIYQHKHWLKQVTDKTGWKLTAVHPVFQWAYSVYSAKHASLDAIPHGGKIALLNDPANTAQALWLLQRAGKITFKPGVDPWAATVGDVASNPNGYRFTFIDYGAGPRILDEVDAVIAYNFQFIAAGTSQKDKIYAPPAPREFAGQLVVGTKYLKDPQVVKLTKVFLDPQVQRYLATTANPGLKDQLSPVSSQ
jgi:ABC-type metal ion transport system substrate-binding protein